MGPKDEQIRVLLAGNALKYACDQLGTSDMCRHQYSEVFTVTRQEVLDYVREYGLPAECSFSSPLSPDDGLFFHESEGKWLVYWGERGATTDLKSFSSYDEAMPHIVDWLLGLSGTGMFPQHRTFARSLRDRLRSLFNMRRVGRISG